MKTATVMTCHNMLTDKHTNKWQATWCRKMLKYTINALTDNRNSSQHVYIWFLLINSWWKMCMHTCMWKYTNVLPIRVRGYIHYGSHLEKYIPHQTHVCSNVLNSPAVPDTTHSRQLISFNPPKCFSFILFVSLELRVMSFLVL